MLFVRGCIKKMRRFATIFGASVYVLRPASDSNYNTHRGGTANFLVDSPNGNETELTSRAFTGPDERRFSAVASPLLRERESRVTTPPRSITAGPVDSIRLLILRRDY